MSLCPFLNTCATSGIVNVMVAGVPGVNGSGVSKLFLNFPRNGSPRTSCW